MHDVFDEPGHLTVDIGEGFLSAYEVAQLKTGDVVRVDQIAGDPVTIRFNGSFVAQAEVVILGDLFCVRLYSLERSISRSGPSTRMEDVLEVLPTAIRLATLEITLAEIAGARPGAIISLGKPYSDEVDAELLVSGVVAGTGKVSVYNENMALRLIELRDRRVESREVRSTGYLLSRELRPQKIKDYNHKRPDRFSSITISKVADIHELFLRNLQAHSKALDEYGLTGVDQMTFDEMLADLQQADAVHGVMRVEAWPPRDEDIHPVGGPLIESRATTRRVGGEARTLIAKLAQAGDSLERKLVLVTTKQTSPIARAMESDRDFVPGSLRAAWRNLVDLNLHMHTVSSDFADIDLIHGREMILTVTFRKADDSFVLVYPYLTLDPMMDVLR